MIGSVVGLLTGDGWNVGAPAPLGYDLYNVPASYRDQYADSNTSAYPTMMVVFTRLIRRL